MNIGFDFDNTIISYDEIFYKIALEKKLIPRNLEKNKSSVKEYLHKYNKYNEFTELQGLVYGKEIMRANPSKGLLKLLEEIKSIKTCKLFIVSHKTQYPYIGEKIDLRKAASKWIGNYLRNEKSRYFKEKNIYYESTIESKIKRINKLKCDVFFDDLPNIIKLLPEKMGRILYDPNKNNNEDNMEKISDWSDLLIDRFRKR